jgi:tripartite-type tricarboxylate transporter receptor subunit TctC
VAWFGRVELLRAGHHNLTIDCRCRTADMHFTRRTLLHSLAAGVMLPGAGSAVAADPPWPARTLKLVSPFNPGGAIDVLNRLIADKLATRLGQQVIVDAIPGANTIKGADAVAKAAPDGYTFMITTMSTHVNNRVLFDKLPFDPQKDFAPITQVSLGSVLLTAPGNAPYSDLKGFVAWAAQQKRPISFGTWGIGSSAHVYGEILRKEHGVDLNHVPYKGELPAITDVIGGNLDVTFTSPVGARPQVAAGKLKALAMAGPARSAAMPEVPTFGEQGFKGFELAVWVAAYAPAGTPVAIVERLQREIAAIIRLPDIAPKLVEQGQTPLGNTPAEFEASFREQAPRWEALIRASGAKAQ